MVADEDRWSGRNQLLSGEGRTIDYQPLAIPDVVLATPKLFGDDRGYFFETFRQSEFVEHCGDYSFVQDNQSRSAHGILRGLHYQLVQPQGKLVRVVQGEVFDVAVDMRRSSETFGQWVGATLSEENKCLLFVPPGFAHGFYVQSESADLAYKCTDYYEPSSERSLAWDDPTVGIDWPLVDGAAPSLSDKDRDGTAFGEADTYD